MGKTFWMIFAALVISVLIIYAGVVSLVKSTDWDAVARGAGGLVGEFQKGIEGGN